jgi:hypothetical protein
MICNFHPFFSQEYTSFRLIHLLNMSTLKMQRQMQVIADCRQQEDEMANHVLTLRILAIEWVEKRLQQLAATDATVFKLIQGEINDKKIDLSHGHEVFSAALLAAGSEQLKRRVVLSAMFSLAMFQRLEKTTFSFMDTPFREYEEGKVRIRKEMEDEGMLPRQVGAMLYEKYGELAKRGDLPKLDVLLKLEKMHVAFKQELDDLLEKHDELHKHDEQSGAQQMDTKLAECYDFVAKIGQLKPVLWKWALGQGFQQSQAKDFTGEEELQNLYSANLEMDKLKTVSDKLQTLKDVAEHEFDNHQELFGGNFSYFYKILILLFGSTAKNFMILIELS